MYDQKKFRFHSRAGFSLFPSVDLEEGCKEEIGLYENLTEDNQCEMKATEQGDIPCDCSSHLLSVIGDETTFMCPYHFFDNVRGNYYVKFD